MIGRPNLCAVLAWLTVIWSTFVIISLYMQAGFSFIFIQFSSVSVYELSQFLLATLYTGICSYQEYH